jgi:hypothetical protein
MFKSKRSWNAWNTKYAGKLAGVRCNDGYWRMGMLGRVYPCHRVAWAIKTGKWPESVIDHANMDRSDNRFCNLRPANKSQNMGNSRIMKTNKTGIKGVYRLFNPDRWVAQTRIEGRPKYLGTFRCPAAASFAYQIAADIKYGEFAYIGLCAA